MAPPRLLPVPNTFNDLVIKATQTGIVLLKEGRFKKRYLGNKYSAVDINGKLYLRSAELKKVLKESNKKSPTFRLRKAVIAPVIDHESSEPGEIPANKKRTCEYRVNKLEVRSRIMAMIRTKKGSKELYFWTITFPLNTPDDIAYQAFNTWLTSLRQKKHLRDYIWIAERQQNGTVHFHIAIPHRMSVVHANRMMRVTLTTFSKKGLINYSTHQCRRYNGVDICKNRKTRRVTNFAIKKGSRALANYLTKYVTKNESPFPHLAWHNSRGFSALFTAITFTVAEFIGYGFKEVILHRSIISNMFFSFYPWRRGEPPEAVSKHLRDLNNYVQEMTSVSVRSKIE
jgi:hypothetical protein